MAEAPYGASTSGGEPAEQPSQGAPAAAGVEHPTSQPFPSFGNLEVQQNALPEQAIPPQPAAPSAVGSIPVHETTTVHPIPIETPTAPPSVTTYTEERRDTIMPPARGIGEPAGANATGSMPQVPPGGPPTRTFLNEKVVPYLVEGMKNVARNQPPDPLRVLGEFLVQKSQEAGETPSATPGQGES